MCHYMFLNDVDSQRWTLMGTVIKLAQSVSRRPLLIPFLLLITPLITRSASVSDSEMNEMK